MISVTIIVPVYQVEKEIADCVRSVIKQTFTDFECLLIDDGTKDKSIEVAESVFQNDKRFKVIHKPNGGLSDARNRGLAEATGEFVLFLDSDDEITEDLLEKTVAVAREHNSDITVFDLLYVYPDGHTAISKGAEKELTSYKEDPTIITMENSACNKLYKASFIKNKQFPKGKWYEDLSVVPVWMAQANHISYVPKAMYLYKQREGSISHSADPRIFDIYDSIGNIKKELGLNPRDLAVLYYDNCLIMTTLRIKEISDREQRLEYYERNIDELNKAYPDWYQDLPKDKYSFKQRIVFFLLKKKMIRFLDRLYAK